MFRNLRDIFFFFSTKYQFKNLTKIY